MLISQFRTSVYVTDTHDHLMSRPYHTFWLPTIEGHWVGRGVLVTATKL